MKKRAKHSLNSTNVKHKDDAHSPNLSARCFCSSGSSRFSPYQISHLEGKGLNNKYPWPGTRDGPELDMMSSSRTRLRAVGSPKGRPPFAVLYSAKPDIRASKPDEDLKYACTRIRSRLSLPTNASASASEIRATVGHHITTKVGISNPWSGVYEFQADPLSNWR